MKQPAQYSELTRSFEAHDVDNATFRHLQHVQVAFELLNKYDFIDATSNYAKGIRAIAAKAGASKKFNTTITYAFMSLIAERMREKTIKDFNDFLARNDDLLSPDILAKWYSPQRLQTDTAREIFLLPLA